MVEARELTIETRAHLAVLFGGLLCVVAPSAARAQALSDAATTGRSRNVMVLIYDQMPENRADAPKPGSCTQENIEPTTPENGSAVVLYADERQVLLLTAEHNVAFGGGCFTFAPAGQIKTDFDGEVLARNTAEDWALVRIKGAGRAFGLHGLLPVRARDEIEEDMLIIGNPGGEPNRLLEVSIERPSGYNLVLKEKVRKGFSGAGVYAPNGDLIAIVTDASSGGFVLPVAHVCPQIEKHMSLPLMKRPPPPRRSVQLNAYLGLARRDLIDGPGAARNGATLGVTVHAPWKDLTISRLALWARFAWDSVEVPERVFPPEPGDDVLQEGTTRAQHLALAFGLELIFIPDYLLQPVIAAAPVLGMQWFSPPIGDVDNALTVGGTGSLGFRFQPPIARSLVIGLGVELSVISMKGADYRFSGFGVSSEPFSRDWYATSRLFLELGFLFL
jgi:S1-C subfamily serine protease